MVRKKKRVVSQNEVLKLLELQLGVIAHCQSLKAVTQLLIDGKTEAAVARLDGAVSTMHALVRGQCAGQAMKCPKCATEQDVVAWVDDGRCNECGEALEIPDGE